MYNFQPSLSPTYICDATFFCRATLCRRAVSVFPSRSCILSKRVIISSKFFTVFFSQQTLWQYSDGDPLTGASNERAIFDQYPASSCVVNGATVRCDKRSAAGPWQVTLISGVCVEQLSEVRVTVLLWPFVAARCYAIDKDIVTKEYMSYLFGMTLSDLEVI